MTVQEIESLGFKLNEGYQSINNNLMFISNDITKHPFKFYYQTRNDQKNIFFQRYNIFGEGCMFLAMVCKDIETLKKGIDLALNIEIDSHLDIFYTVKDPV